MDSTASPRGRPRSEAKNAELLWAAAQLFGERGVAATSTRDIAARAQTTERTLFKHFGSKDGLVRAVLDEAVLAHLTPLSLARLTDAVQAFGGDLPSWHAAFLRARLEALSVAPELTRLLLGELLRDTALRERFADQWLTAVWQPLLGLFTAEQQAGRLRADLPAAALVRQFLSLNLGFLVSRLLLAPGHPWDDSSEIAALAAGFAALARPQRPAN